MTTATENRRFHMPARFSVRLCLLLGFGLLHAGSMASQCGENLVLNGGFEEVGPPCGAVPPGGLVNGAFNQSCVDPWQSAWGTPSVCAFGVYAGNHVACFGSNNEGIFQEVILESDPCGPYTLTFWYRGISGFSGNLHVYLGNGLVNVPTSNSGNPPLVIQPDWDLLAILPVTDNTWRQAVVNDVEASIPANTQLVFLDVPTGILDVSIDEVFLGYLPPGPEDIGFTLACVDQDGATFTLEANVADPPPGYDPDLITWDFGDGNSGNGESVMHTYSANGVYTACAAFPDDCGCPFETCMTITVNACSCACGTDDLPPVFMNLPAPLIEVNCFDEIPGVPVVEIFDPCDENPAIAYSETEVGPPCDQTITRIWTASDACGNTSVTGQVIRVEDLEAPEWIVEPSDITIGCEDVEQEFALWIASYAGASAADNCSAATLMAETISTPGMSCATAQAAFIAMDNCGNAIQRIATFTIDNAPPEILIAAANLVSPCSIPAPEVVNAWLLIRGGATAAADCGNPTWTNDYSGLTGDSTQVTFTAENTCGLTETTTAWILAGTSPPPVYDTIFTCDAASAGTTTTSLQVGDCLVPLFLTALYVPGDTVLVDSFICEGTPGKDTFHYTNRYGCDSLVLRRIISVPNVIVSIDIQTCRPDTIGETNIVLPGTPCDTILQISVTVLPPDETFITDTVCDPALAGSDVIVFSRPSGCDSIVYEDHIYTPLPIRLMIIDSCGPGVDFTDTLRVPGIPCDSLVLIQYRFHPKALTELTLTTCDPGMPASDTLTLTSILGCDSIVITTYLYRAADTTYIGVQTCDLGEVMSDTLLLQDSGGCDSLVIRMTSYAGADTLRIQSETCDPAAAGTTVTVRPGMPCDTVVETITLLVQTLTRRDTIDACGRGSPVTDTLRFTTSFGCDSLVFRTTIFNPLDPDLALIDESCAGLADGSITLIAIRGGTPPYLASLDGGPFTAGQGGAFPRFDNLAPGPHTLLIRNAEGCRDTSDITLSTGQVLAISAGADMVGEPGAIIQLSGATSDPFGSWQWTASDPLSCDTCLLTSLGPLTTPQWVVLSGITPAGCTDLDSVFLQLRADIRWSVPNVFSPNGDGLNDVFRPFVEDNTIILRRFEVYDRWGNLLFALQASQPAFAFPGWDGTMNGRPLSPGVYVYVMELHAPNEKTIGISGDITLLR